MADTNIDSYTSRN